MARFIFSAEKISKEEKTAYSAKLLRCKTHDRWLACNIRTRSSC